MKMAKLPLAPTSLASKTILPQSDGQDTASSDRSQIMLPQRGAPTGCFVGVDVVGEEGCFVGVDVVGEELGKLVGLAVGAKLTEEPSTTSYLNKRVQQNI